MYIFGVLAGSLTTSIFRPTVYLSGASGGVYALITAHLGTVIMNFRYHVDTLIDLFPPLESRLRVLN